MISVRVALNEQQIELIEKIRKEGKHGDDIAQVVGSVFRQWLKEKGLADA